jgi:hypothetical protein
MQIWNTSKCSIEIWQNLLRTQALVSVKKFWQLYTKIIQGTYLQMTQNNISFRMSWSLLRALGIYRANMPTIVLFYDELFTKLYMTSMQSSPSISENYNKALSNREIFHLCYTIRRYRINARLRSKFSQLTYL